MGITFKETKIGRIPEEWELHQAKRVACVNMGQSPSSSDCNNKGIGVPFLQGNADFGDKYPKISSWTTNPTKIAKPNDILMSVRAPVGDINLADTECCIGRGLCAITPKSGADLLFLYYILRSSMPRLLRFQQGSTFLAINKQNIDSHLIPLPPLPEQSKIAEILSTVDETIEKTDAIIQETQQLKKGLMQKLFVNKAFMVLRKAKEEETDLKPIAIHELGEIVTGTTPSTTVREYYDNPEYMFIGPADIGQSKRIVKSANYISKEGFAVSRQLPYNAVMVVGIGATIGKVGITSEPCTTNQQINTIIPNTREFPADYVYYLLAGISYYVLAFAGQTATPIMNKGEFGKMLTFIHPTLEERQKIADILSEVDAKIETEQAFKSELEQFKKGLMQVLLTGKVRVKV